MSNAWTRAVEEGADALGEMLIEMAGGEADYTNEDLAAAALDSGLHSLLGDEPDLDRVAATARVLHQRLHEADKQDKQGWDSLTATERAFWLDLARAAVAASDAALLLQTRDGP